MPSSKRRRELVTATERRLRYLPDEENLLRSLVTRYPPEPGPRDWITIASLFNEGKPPERRRNLNSLSCKWRHLKVDPRVADNGDVRTSAVSEQI